MASTTYTSDELAKYADVLRPVAYNLTKNMTAAEDLLQDTFYRALVNLDKFTKGTSMQAWLFTIMRNIFINDYRRAKKRLVVTDESPEQHVINNTKATVRNAVERSFAAEDIYKAVEQVGKDFTEPFMMFYRGFHYQEIAEHLDIPVGTVKSRIFFARKELQSKLREFDIHHSSYFN
jgi:RNA polymerase sigma-70 factor (ECF subfamily)